MWWLTDTALFRTYAMPVFLSPINWPKNIWKQCACK